MSQHLSLAHVNVFWFSHFQGCQFDFWHNLQQKSPKGARLTAVEETNRRKEAARYRNTAEKTQRPEMKLKTIRGANVKNSCVVTLLVVFWF